MRRWLETLVVSFYLACCASLGAFVALQWGPRVVIEVPIVKEIKPGSDYWPEQPTGLRI